MPLFICIRYLLYALCLLLFPLSGFFFKLKYTLMQIPVPPLQCPDFIAAEKRADTLGDVGSCGCCRTFQLFSLYLPFRPSEFLLCRFPAVLKLLYICL